jgi:hypothetical protein
MHVRIASGPDEPQVSLEEADDCTRLHVVADGLDDAGAGAVLRRDGLGRAGDPGHAWLEISTLRARARASVGAGDWDDRFEVMVSYARGKGWLDETGEFVAAHIERSTP